MKKNKVLWCIRKLITLLHLNISFENSHEIFSYEQIFVNNPEKHPFFQSKCISYTPHNINPTPP